MLPTPCHIQALWNMFSVVTPQSIPNHMCLCWGCGRWRCWWPYLTQLMTTNVPAGERDMGIYLLYPLSLVSPNASNNSKGLPWWLRWERICLQCWRHGFDPWVRKILWRREWQFTLVFLPGESHGQKSLVGSWPWGFKELDTTEWLTIGICASHMLSEIYFKMTVDIYQT